MIEQTGVSGGVEDEDSEGDGSEERAGESDAANEINEGVRAVDSDNVVVVG